MEEEIITTKSELIKAYELWNKNYKENPKEFEEATNAECQADYLIEMIEETRK